MSGSSRISDSLKINGVFVVPFGSQIPDLDILYRAKGRKVGYDCFSALIGMDFGITELRYGIDGVIWFDLSGLSQYRHGLDIRIVVDLILISEGLRRDDFSISSDLSDDLQGIFVRGPSVSFLSQHLWRLSRIKASLLRSDTIDNLLGFVLINIGSIWIFLGFKSRDSEAAKVQNTSVPFVSNFSILLSFSCSVSWEFYSQSGLSGFSCVTMSQSSLLGKESVEKSLGAVVSKMRIKIPSFDNSALIKGYAKTMIGRCMNPRKQDMKGLLLMFPRICQVEGRVAGADLGLGRFQLDFDEEEDIVEVLKMEPFHFDGWMVSLVRWKPSVDSSYPSTLTFWVRVLGIPIEYWAHPTFESIGDALGKVVEVDINGGRVQVIIDGFKPLCFETTIEFGSGEETMVSLRYERLFGYCSYCFSLCHDVEHCEKKYGVRAPTSHSLVGADGAGAHSWSYKGAVVQDRQLKHGSEGKGKGITTGKDREEERIEPSNPHAIGSGKGKQSRFVQGEGSSRYKRFTNYAQFNDHRFNEQKKLKAKAKEASKVTTAVPTEIQVVQSVATKPKKIVRKVLVFEDEATQVPEQSLEKSGQCGLVHQGIGPQVEVSADPVSNDQAVPLTDLDMGDSTLDTATFDAVDDLLMNQSEEGVMAEEVPELETDADFVSDPTLLASLDQIVADLGTDAFELAEEELGSVEEEDKRVTNAEQESASTKVNDKGKGKAGSVAKKKASKGLVLPGVTTRKRIVQALVSPRKRSVPKHGPNPGEDKFPPNQGPENGGPGGSQAPNTAT